MSGKVQIGARVTGSSWRRFREWVRTKHGKIDSVLGDEVEAALDRHRGREDRLDRIENKLDEVLIRLDEIDGSHAHKQSETLAKVERVANRLHQLGRTVIPDDEVVRAIERGPGGDDRTIEKYQTQLKRQGLAYEHPTDEVWFVDVEPWTRTVEAYLDNNPTADLHDVLEPYPEGVDDYEQLVEREVLA